MLTEKELFQKAFALVSNPETWCQMRYRTEDGRFCSIGALCEVLHIQNPLNCPNPKSVHPLEDRLDEAARRAEWGGVASIGRYNDTHTHEEVVALWRKVGEENGWL